MGVRSNKSICRSTHLIRIGGNTPTHNGMMSPDGVARECLLARVREASFVNFAMARAADRLSRSGLSMDSTRWRRNAAGESSADFKSERVTGPIPGHAPTSSSARIDSSVGSSASHTCHAAGVSYRLRTRNTVGVISLSKQFAGDSIPDSQLTNRLRYRYRSVNH
jgi:hypothetical protein